MATERQDVDVEIVDNTEDSRFEGYVEGALAGFVVYEREPGRLVLQHTEVDDSFEGQGVGSKLAAGVLDEIRRRGLVIDA
ncbi:MAG: N-acetyltransferase, partial [Actinobacteria bacterium]|nr:N-acetyltransferase [Actinomycetota bacterium]